jgi:hypothetical protein
VSLLVCDAHRVVLQVFGCAWTKLMARLNPAFDACRRRRRRATSMRALKDLHHFLVHQPRAGPPREVTVGHPCPAGG